MNRTKRFLVALAIIVTVLLTPTLAHASDPAVKLYFDGQKWTIEVNVDGPFVLIVNGNNMSSPSQPAPPAQLECPTTLGQLAQYGEILRELTDDKGQLAGAVVKFSSIHVQNKLRDCGWLLQGDNPDVKSAWAPQDRRPLPR